MVVSKNYKIKEQNGMYYIVPSSVPGCPQCGGEMKIRDSKRRKVIFADGTVDTFVLRRYKCTVCGRVHLELPDIMGKGQILRPTPNTAPLICGACYNTQPEDLLTMA